jgi:predicted transcriptional regulator
MTDTQNAILRLLENKSLSRKEIFAGIGMKGDSRSFKRIVEPLIAAGFVERTVPDKPKSSLQKYRLTDKGRALLTGNAP